MYMHIWLKNDIQQLRNMTEKKKEEKKVVEISNLFL